MLNLIYQDPRKTSSFRLVMDSGIFVSLVLKLDRVNPMVYCLKDAGKPHKSLSKLYRLNYSTQFKEILEPELNANIMVNYNVIELTMFH